MVVKDYYVRFPIILVLALCASMLFFASSEAYAVDFGNSSAIQNTKNKIKTTGQKAQTKIVPKNPVNIESLRNNNVSVTTETIAIEGMGDGYVSTTTETVAIEGMGDGYISATTDTVVIEGKGDGHISATTDTVVIEGKGVDADSEPPLIIKEPIPEDTIKNKNPKKKKSFKQKIQSVKLLQVKGTSRGGSLPFDATDVEEEIAPAGIIANSASDPVTCGVQTFPIAGFSNGPIFVRFPDDGGTCEIGLSVSNASEVAFRITPFSASSATITAQNGWSADQPDIFYSVGFTTANTLVLSRDGVSYTIGIDAQGTGIGASFPIFITVTSFSGSN